MKVSRFQRLKVSRKKLETLIHWNVGTPAYWRIKLSTLTLVAIFIPFFLKTAATFAADDQPKSNDRNSIISKTLDIFSGYYKILATFSKSNTTKENIAGVLQRLRLELNPKLTKNLTLDLVYDHELLLNDFSNTSDFGLIRQNNQKNFAFLDLDKVISDTDHVYERHLLHRAYLKYESGHSRWTLGKQLIDWGRLRFYSALDLFNQPLPSNIEADERLGFDALNVELFSDNFSGINLIYGPGRNDDKNSYGLKLYKKIKTYDTFLIAAKHEEDKIMGLGFDGYLLDAGLRGEFTYTKSGKERYPRAGIGLDYSFTPKTTVTLEYFYNGAANGDFGAFSTSLIESRKRLSLQKHLVSGMASYDVTPLLKFKALGIFDIIGKSAFLNPELRYNITENFDAAIGAQCFIESEGSEFQDQNNVYYAELKYFF